MTEPLPVGTEALGVCFEKWRVPHVTDVEMYEALAIIPLDGATILLKKKFALALAEQILAHFRAS